MYITTKTTISFLVPEEELLRQEFEKQIDQREWRVDASSWVVSYTWTNHYKSEREDSND